MRATEDMDDAGDNGDSADAAAIWTMRATAEIQPTAAMPV